ncbi:unnamed protein product [Amoebophrya sp. A120]|nr:unnamed protein product [Amoebophrya sp. A120]|eukprot:GSA120T00024056001.1
MHEKLKKLFVAGAAALCSGREQSAQAYVIQPRVTKHAIVKQPRQQVSDKRNTPKASSAARSSAQFVQVSSKSLTERQHETVAATRKARQEHEKRVATSAKSEPVKLTMTIAGSPKASAQASPPAAAPDGVPPVDDHTASGGRKSGKANDEGINSRNLMISGFVLIVLFVGISMCCYYAACYKPQDETGRYFKEQARAAQEAHEVAKITAAMNQFGIARPHSKTPAGGRPVLLDRQNSNPGVPAAAMTVQQQRASAQRATGQRTSGPRAASAAQAEAVVVAADFEVPQSEQLTEDGLFQHEALFRTRTQELAAAERAAGASNVKRDIM